MIALLIAGAIAGVSAYAGFRFGLRTMTSVITRSGFITIKKHGDKASFEQFLDVVTEELTK